MYMCVRDSQNENLHFTGLLRWYLPYRRSESSLVVSLHSSESFGHPSVRENTLFNLSPLFVEEKNINCSLQFRSGSSVLFAS